MIDVAREKLITLADAAAVFGVTRKTIYEWVNRRDRRLETIRPGGRGMRYTSMEAIQRFMVQDESSERAAAILPTGLTRESALQQLEALRSR
jgi:excisionase family DNA binding protein